MSLAPRIINSYLFHLFLRLPRTCFNLLPFEPSRNYFMHDSLFNFGRSEKLGNKLKEILLNTLAKRSNYRSLPCFWKGESLLGTFGQRSVIQIRCRVREEFTIGRNFSNDTFAGIVFKSLMKLEVLPATVHRRFFSIPLI